MICGAMQLVYTCETDVKLILNNEQFIKALLQLKSVAQRAFIFFAKSNDFDPKFGKL